jgi:hypothetical protein
MKEYIKIETVYERDVNGTKKLIEGRFRNELVRYLKDCIWDWTEKIDGTNIGVVWDGHSVSFQGRTEKAQISSKLFIRLNDMFCGETNEELFEQTFGEKNVILFGEGYGHKIQKAGDLYNPDNVDFILFDVYFPDKDLWLTRDNVESIATTFGIDCVPLLFEGDIDSAVRFVKSKPQSTIGSAPMEGVVGRPMVELRDREGNRVIVKVKVRDFE